MGLFRAERHVWGTLTQKCIKSTQQRDLCRDIRTMCKPVNGQCWLCLRREWMWKRSWMLPEDVMTQACLYEWMEISKTKKVAAAAENNMIISHEQQMRAQWAKYSSGILQMCAVIIPRGPKNLKMEPTKKAVCGFEHMMRMWCTDLDAFNWVSSFHCFPFIHHSFVLRVRGHYPFRR